MYSHPFLENFGVDGRSSSKNVGEKTDDTFETDFTQQKTSNKRKSQFKKNRDELNKASDKSMPTCIASESEYTYDELLKLIFNITVTEAKHKLTLRPPQMQRLGTKKTVFVNFTDTAKALNRPQEHLLKFLLVELGTCGSLDGNQQLIIKGRFEPKQIENVLRRYVKEYVKCLTCHSHETRLQKEKQLFFLKCRICCAHFSVAGIESGFQALAKKR